MVGDQQRFVAKLRSRNSQGLIVKDEVISEGLHETTFPDAARDKSQPPAR